MSKLEKRLRQIAEAGELVGLSVVPVAGKGPNDLVFVATYMPATRVGTSVARNADPVVAMLGALDSESPPLELVTPIARAPRKKKSSAQEAVGEVLRAEKIEEAGPPPAEPWDV